jgi:hypothetical protein
MARNTDKIADSTSGEMPSANTDALLDPIPDVLTKTVELSSNLPPRLADVQTHPNSISEELHSANIDASLVNTRDVVAEEAPNVAEETPGVSIDSADAVAGTTTKSTVGDDAPPLVNDSVQLSMNDGVLSEECAAGIACTSPQGRADLSGCTHRCWGCGGRVHSLFFCGMSLETNGRI